MNTRSQQRDLGPQELNVAGERSEERFRDSDQPVLDGNQGFRDSDLLFRDSDQRFLDPNLSVLDGNLPLPDAMTRRTEKKASNTMNEEHLNKWKTAALDLEETPSALKLPFHVLAGEAIDVVRFCQRNWEPEIDRDGRVERPGLKSAVGNGTFTAAIVDEMLELNSALQIAQTKYLLIVAAPNASLIDKAHAALDELRQTLEWYFDDGKLDEADAQLAVLGSTHENPLSHDAVAAALFDYAELADRHRAGVTGLGNFDPRVIDDARVLVDRLRERSAGPSVTVSPQGERAAYELRNRIGAMLFDRMQRARGAARFVFRKHPALVREVTSGYWRKSRAASRHKAEAAASAVPPVAGAPGLQLGMTAD